MTAPSVAPTVDEKQLYGRYNSAESRRLRFRQKIAHKAANIPMEEEMFIDNSRRGLGAWGVAGIATAAGVPGLLAAAMAAWMATRPDPAPTTPVPTTPPAVTDSEYEVRFWQQLPDGTYKQIDVPRIAPSTKE